MARRTILIIDDTPAHRTILRHLLLAAGYRVIETGTGAEALQQVRNLQPDLILAELSLPGQSAWETTRQLREQCALRDTPILGTTIYNTLLSSSRIRAIGCNGCIQKPFNVDDVLTSVTNLLHTTPATLSAA